MTLFAPIFSSDYAVYEKVALFANVLVALAGLLYAFLLMRQVRRADQGTPRMQEIARAIREGANAYLYRQFRVVAVLIVVITVLLYVGARISGLVMAMAVGRALSFLVGEGKLQQSFTLKKLDARQMKFEGGFVIEAKPKEATPAYKAMILYVDAATAQVRRVLLVDAQGNRNRFDFSNPAVNTKIEQTEFTFAPPAGTQIVRQ